MTGKFRHCSIVQASSLPDGRKMPVGEHFEVPPYEAENRRGLE